jgi:hypothetical protein
MIFISCDIRVINGPLKNTSIERLISDLKPKILMFQEKMMEEATFLNALQELFPTWNYYAISSKGHLRGIYIAWSPSFLKYNKLSAPSTL